MGWIVVRKTQSAFRPAAVWRDSSSSPRAPLVGGPWPEPVPLAPAERVASERQPSSLGRQVEVSGESQPSAPGELTLHVPKTPASVPASPTQPGVLAFDSGPQGGSSKPTDSQGPMPKDRLLSIPAVAEQVYRLLERKLVAEQERRGIFS